jgi:hypothetical protein
MQKSWKQWEKTRKIDAMKVAVREKFAKKSETCLETKMKILPNFFSQSENNKE